MCSVIFLSYTRDSCSIRHPLHPENAEDASDDGKGATFIDDSAQEEGEQPSAEENVDEESEKPACYVVPCHASP